MESFKIASILEHNCYVLKNEKRKIELIIEFYKLPQVSVGDKIMISEKLLNPKSQLWVQPYAFKLTTEKTPNEIKELDSIEYAVVGIQKKLYPLKRVYG